MTLIAFAGQTLLGLVQGARVAFLPDVSIGGGGLRWFYPSLMADSSPCMHGRTKFFRNDEVYCSMNFLDMPNPYESNTKRYEVQWLEFMRDTLDLSSYDVVVGHGSSAEAVLRYMEQQHYKPLNAVVVLDAYDLYTAGERHGRKFHHSKIKRNTLQSHVIVGSTSKERQEQSKELRSELFQYHNHDNDHDLFKYLASLEEKLFEAPEPSQCVVSDSNSVTADEATENFQRANKAFNKLLNFCIKQSLKKTIV